MSNNFFSSTTSTPSPSQPPVSRPTIIDYALRKLGAPVIEINVDDDQLEDRLDDALQLFREFHYDGVEKLYLKHQITQADKDNEFISAPDPIQAVTRVFVFGDLALNNLFNFPTRFSLSQLGSFANFGLGSFVNLTTLDITKQWLSLAEMFISPEHSIRFNKVTNKIRIDMDWKTDVAVDQFLVFEVFVVVDPEAFREIFNEIWMKEYFTALVKRQWGQNLSKFVGIQLPGGVTFNGKEIMQEAQTELDKLIVDLDKKWQLPVDFMVG